MQLPRGQRTKLYVDRQKTAQSFFGALSLTSKKWSELGFSDSGERLVQAALLWRLGSAFSSLEESSTPGSGCSVRHIATQLPTVRRGQPVGPRDFGHRTESLNDPW